MSELAAVIIGHQRIPLYDGTDGNRCSACDHLLGATDGPNSPRHAEHLAEQVTAWVAERLAAPEMREAVAEAVILPDWCDEHGQERCDYVYHWPADEADLHRNGNFASFAHRAEMVDAMRRQKRADNALAAVTAHLCGESS